MLPSLRAATLLSVLTLGAVLPAAPLPAQEAAARLLVERALTALDSTDVERAIDLLKRAIGILPENVPRDLRTRVFANLGAAHWALGERDSATAYFGQLLRADPFYQIDTVRFNPQIVRTLNDLRRRTVAAALALPRDTSFGAASGQLPLHLRVTSPSTVTTTLSRVGQAGRLTLLDSSAIEEHRDITLPARDIMGRFLASGEYEVTASRIDSSGARQRLTSRRIRFTLTQEDTVALEPPLPDSAFRPEHRTGSAGVSAALRGLFLGGVAVALPFVARNSALVDLKPGDSRSIGVGVTLAVAGLGAFAVLAPGRPMAANVRFNESLRAGWSERNARIQQDNARKRSAARVRIEDLGETRP